MSTQTETKQAGAKAGAKVAGAAFKAKTWIAEKLHDPKYAIPLGMLLGVAAEHGVNKARESYSVRVARRQSN